MGKEVQKLVLERLRERCVRKLVRWMDIWKQFWGGGVSVGAIEM